MEQAASVQENELFPKPTQILCCGLCLGLTGGIIEAGFWAWKRFALGRLIFFDEHILWLPPLLGVAILLPILLVLVPLAFSKRFGPTFALVVFLLLLPLLLSLAFLFLPIYIWASALLAIGAAKAVSNGVKKHPRAFLRLMRGGAVFSSVVVSLLAAGTVGCHWWQTNRLASRLPVPPDGAPNVLWIVLDTVRADWCSAYGYGEPTTPNLGRLAQEAVLFERAIAASSWTLPAHATMFTGRWPKELSADWIVPMDTGPLTVAEHLASQGYGTAAFAANTIYCTAETGLDRGFLLYDDFRRDLPYLLRSLALTRRLLDSDLPIAWGYYDSWSRRSAAEINRSALDWLRQRPDRPFFLFLNYFDAHSPYITPDGTGDHCPETYAQGYLLRRWLWLTKDGLDKKQVEWVRGAYLDCLRSLDKHVGDLLARLAFQGDLDNTLFIVTGDHGEHFGEKELFLHGCSLYQPVVHVPLLLSWPGTIPSGLRVSEFVSHRDLPATVVDLLGLQKETFPGRSLRRYWSDETDTLSPERGSPIALELLPHPTFPPNHGNSPAYRGPMKAVIKGQHKHIFNGDGQEELYDLDSDPNETKDLLAGGESGALGLGLNDRVLQGADAGDGNGDFVTGL